MSDGEELPGIVPAIYVGIDKVGTGKGWSGEEWEFGDYHHYGGGFPAAVFFGVIIVSITWTHRPELSVLDIMREAVKEIKIMRAGKERQKGKTE